MALLIFSLIFMDTPLDRTRLHELIFVVIALALIAGVIFVAFVRPRQRVEGVRSQDDSNMMAIMKAIDQLKNESGGSLDGALKIDAVPTLIGSGIDEVNVCRVLVPTYLVAMPYRFEWSHAGVQAHYASCNDYETGYVISRDALGVVKIEAAVY